jgi:hypothetical protein
MSLRIGKKVVLSVFSAAFVLVGGSVFVQSALAATGQLYITPASASVQKDSNVSVNVRLNPGGNTDTVTVTVGYDPSKLRYVSTDYSGSPYNTQVGTSSTSNSISFSSTELTGTPVTTDSQVARLTFTALVGTGTASLTLSGNAANGGTPTNPGTAGATLTLTTPATPTPTPSPTPTLTPTPAPVPTTGTTNSGTSGTKTSAGASSAPIGAATPTAAPATPGSTPVLVTDKKIQYTQAVLGFTSPTPTQVYIRYGIDGSLTSTTPVSGFATTHSIALDPSLLVPGQTYSYVAVSTNQQGITTQSAVQTFATKGLKITVGVFDTTNKPIRNKTVTLHSTPQTATTDDKGIATFNNVAPGDHHVIYTAGKKSYDQQVSVLNNIQTTGGTQTAEPQNFAVVYGLKQTSLHVSSVVWVSIVVLILATIVVLAQAGRLGIALQFHKHPSVPLVSMPVVVGNTAATTPVMPATSYAASPSPASPGVDSHLSAIPDPTTPQPGSTITPRTSDDESSSEQ